MTTLTQSAVGAAEPRDRLWRAIGAYGLSELAQRGTRIATTVLIARTLTAFELGVAALAITVFEIVRVAANAGTGQAVVRAPADKLAATCATAHRLGWAICIGLFVLQGAVGAAMGFWTGRDGLAAMVVALGCVYLVMPAGLVQSYLLLREQRHGTLAAVATVQAVADNVLTVVLAVCGFGPWAIVLPKVVTSPIWLIGMRRVQGWRPSLGHGSAGAVEMLRFAVPVVAAELVTMARMQLDRVLVGAMLGVEALGIYYFVSNAGVGISHALTTALSNSLYPVLAAVGGAPRALLATLDESLRRKALPIAGVVALQAVLAPIYVPLLFGARWAPVAWMVGTLCGAAVCKVFADAGVQALRAAGLTGLEFTGMLAITAISLMALAVGLQGGLGVGVIMLAVVSGVVQLAFAVLARWWIAQKARGA